MSRLFDDSEGKLTFDFQLEASNGTRGAVVDQSGKPVEGARTHYVLPGRGIEVRRSVIEDGATINSVSDAEGKFVLPEQDQTYAIMVIADEGYAFVLEEDFVRAKGEIRISPWATVRGKCMIGAKPAAGEQVMMYVEPKEAWPKELQASQWYECTVQQDGSYEMKRVPPNVTCTIGRAIMYERKNGGAIRSYSHTRQFKSEANEQTTVNIGGTGRPVIGKVKMPKDAKRQVEDWNNITPSAHPINLEESRPNQGYPFVINEDGTFRIEDLPAGDYRLLVMALDMKANNDNLEIGRIETTFNVPDTEGARSDDPFDLGTLEITLK